MQAYHETDSFRALHESTFRRRATVPGSELPADYASTLVPLSIVLAESGETYT